ncbi:MAG TPA: AI-2E family transporter [Clostridiales bacterium]|nr:AI-2E family transporter [Clostridiales bacterium]
MKFTRKHVWISVALVISFLILWLLFKQWIKWLHILRILAVGAIFAYILTPASDFLERKMSRTAAIAVIILLAAALVAVVALLFIPRIVNEALVLAERFPSIMQYIRNVLGSIQNRMETMGIPKGIQDSLTDYADTFQKKATESVMHFLERLAAGVSYLPSLFIELVLGFYFLKDREYFARVLVNIIPLRSRRTILQAASEMNHILHCFIRGEILIASVVGILATIGYLLTGLPYALILGFLAGLFEFIPYFGPWMGAVPAVIVAYISGPNKLFWTLVVILLIQQLENVFITPRILSGVVDLHPVYIILSLWTGGLFFGVAGMFLAVPAVLILRVTIKHIYLSIVAVK